MHIGRRYTFTEFFLWTRWETLYLVGWSLLVTLLLQLSPWGFLTMPAPILAVIGSALAIIVGFKNQQCYARFNEALGLAGQLMPHSLALGNKLNAFLGSVDAAQSAAVRKDILHRHVAWLTALRYFLRDRKPWENTLEAGNARFLAKHPTPESQLPLKDALKACLPDADVEKIIAYRGDKEAFILRRQYEAVTDLYDKKLISEFMLTVLTGVIDELSRVQGALKRIKSYPYARNYQSITLILMVIFVALLPLCFFPYAQDLGKPAGLGRWTAWLNVPFSAIVGWVFVSLEKVGENSSNPFEGGSNDVPISFITRRIEIELMTMLGEATELKPIEAKNNILF